MRPRKGQQKAIVAGTTAALASLARSARAATVTWSNATPPGVWSSAANWTGGTGTDAEKPTVSGLTAVLSRSGGGLCLTAGRHLCQFGGTPESAALLGFEILGVWHTSYTAVQPRGGNIDAHAEESNRS